MTLRTDGRQEERKRENDMGAVGRSKKSHKAQALFYQRAGGNSAQALFYQRAGGNGLRT
jgi:hypothetical protein